MKALSLITLFILSLHSIVAQTGTIIGTVMSNDKQVIPSVSIELDRQKTKTDEVGKFKIVDIPYGIYTLVFEKEGFYSKTVEVKIEQNETNLEFVLQTKEKQLDQITVIGTRSQNEKPVEIGKIGIRPLDLPQSVATVDKEVIEQQQSQLLSDVLKNTNGVYIAGNTGGYQEEIAGRGFAFGSSNTFKNGVRFNNAVMPEISALERLEIMKGSAALLFGNVAAGGVLNLVTKKPQFEKGGSVTMTAGSYSYFKPTVDLYGAVNKKNTIAYRVNSSYQNSKSFRDQVAAERFYVNPSLLFLIGKKTEILLEGDYLKDNRTADYGVGVINYTLIDIPRSTFIGTPWQYVKTQQGSFTASITHQLNSQWKIKSTNSVQVFQNDLFGASRPNASGKFIQEDGTWIRGLQRTAIEESYYISQLDLTGKFKTGKITHNLLVGAEIDQYYTNTMAYNALSTYDTINIFSINTENQRGDIPTLKKNTDTKTPRTRTGFYIQDMISITKKLKVLAGVRFSYLETKSNVYTHSTKKTTYSTLYDHAFSPRVGLVFQPINTMSLFSSYSNSFTPNIGVDIHGLALAPSLIDQFELGVKNDFFKGFLSVNVTAYQIKNSNVAQMVLDNGNTNSNIKELAGEITSKGIELDIVARQWHGLTIMAGYNFNETKYTKSTIYAAGTRLNYQPRNTANASINYQIRGTKLNGLNFGISSLYFGKRTAGRIPRLTVPNDTYRQIPLPEYVTLDASVGYTKGNVGIRFKVSNIFNALSYNVHDDNSVNPIAPRMFMTTLTLKL